MKPLLLLISVLSLLGLSACGGSGEDGSTGAKAPPEKRMPHPAPDPKPVDSSVIGRMSMEDKRAVTDCARNTEIVAKDDWQVVASGILIGCLTRTIRISDADLDPIFGVDYERLFYEIFKKGSVL